MSIKDLPAFAFTLFRWMSYVILPFQLVLLYLASFYFKLYFTFVNKESRKRKIAIGVTETARLIHFLGEVFPSRYTCVLDKNPFYSDKYSFGPYKLIFRPFVGPVLLAYLSELAETFVYISFTGYLIDRRFDFSFLKGRNKKIVIMFCGSDIRSLKLTKEYFQKRNEDSYTSYLAHTDNVNFDNIVKKTAADADQYADLIFNWAFDQMGYLTKPTIPWPYMVNLEELNYEFKMPAAGEKIVILHASGHPVSKGTPLVRAAIKKLELEGYNFEYIELIKVPHSQILQQLARSHIVMQEFYALVPGVFGIEALAKGNAVLVSADPSVNPELPAEAKDAWVVTRYWQVYDNLKALLDRPEQIQQYAVSGRTLIEKHYANEVVQQFYKDTFAKHGLDF